MSSLRSYKRYLGLDLSLSSPGFAAIDVVNRLPVLVAAINYKTKPKEHRGLRYHHIQAVAQLFMEAQGPFDATIREKFHSRNPDTNATVFGAWASVDRAMYNFDLNITVSYTPNEIKKAVAGKGTADKLEVETAVRHYLRLSPIYKFSSNDASDACAVALCYLLKEGLIDHG